MRPGDETNKVRRNDGLSKPTFIFLVLMRACKAVVFLSLNDSSKGSYRMYLENGWLERVITIYKLGKNHSRW